MMMLKKLAIIGVASMSLSGLAYSQQEAAACSGDCAITATSSAQSVAYAAQTDMFVVNSFTFAVSSNVGLNSAEDTVAMAVGTASSKGRNAYTGSSNGGSVTNCGDATTGSDLPAVPTPSLTSIAGCSENDAVVSGS